MHAPHKLRKCCTNRVGGRCKGFCIWCIVNTMGFPLEHMLWDRAPYFKLIPPMLGIH